MRTKFDDYGTYMWLILGNNCIGRRIDNYTLGYEKMTGCFYWQHNTKDIIVYATPFWEDTDGIPWVVYDEENAAEDKTGVESFDLTFNSEEDIHAYMHVVRKILKEIE